MKKIGEYVKWYVYITTSILMVEALIFGMYGAEKLPGETLWQIMVSGLATTLLTVAMVYVSCLLRLSLRHESIASPLLTVPY